MIKFVKNNGIKVNGSTVYHGDYEKPVICPYCGISTDAKYVKYCTFPYDDDKQVYVFALQCTSCQKNFITVYIREEDGLRFNSIVPIMGRSALHNGLVVVSPRFAELHKQAVGAEARGDFDIAAIGYRTALEILLKDYAINVNGKNREDIENKSLSVVISECVTNETFNAADVVRIIGNDYTHYVNAHPEVSFETVKYYYDAFLRNMALDYDMRHPPVHR